MNGFLNSDDLQHRVDACPTEQTKTIGTVIAFRFPVVYPSERIRSVSNLKEYYNGKEITAHAFDQARV